MADQKRAGEAPAAGVSGDAVWFLPLIGVFAWWIHDLSFQWASLVEYRFGWMVAALALYLAWERWPTRPPPSPAASAWPSLAAVLAVLPLVAVAELYKTGVARVPWTSLAVSLGGAVVVVAYARLIWGMPFVRHFFFPIAFLFLAVPLPQLIWDPIVQGLRGVLTSLNVEILGLLGVPAVRQGNLIRLPSGVVAVDEACSGIRSLQSSLMAALFIGDLLFRRAGWKVVFLAAGVALALIGNLGRALFLSLMAYRSGPAALDAVHDGAGWSVLLFTASGVGFLAWWLGRLESRLAAGRDRKGTKP